MKDDDNYVILESGLGYRWLGGSDAMAGVFIKQQKEGVKNQLILLTIDEVKQIEQLIMLGDSLQPKWMVGSTIVSIAGGQVIISQQPDLLVISVQEFREIAQYG